MNSSSYSRIETVCVAVSHRELGLSGAQNVNVTGGFTEAAWCVASNTNPTVVLHTGHVRRSDSLQWMRCSTSEGKPSSHWMRHGWRPLSAPFVLCRDTHA